MRVPPAPLRPTRDGYLATPQAGACTGSKSSGKETEFGVDNPATRFLAPEGPPARSFYELVEELGFRNCP